MKEGGREEESNTSYIFYSCNIAQVFNGFSEIDIGIRDFPGAAI
jgi:hypothetical protein